MVTAVPIDKLIPKDHPIRFVKRLADEALHQLDPHFQARYAPARSPECSPGTIAQGHGAHGFALERQLSERIQYDLLFRWFLDMQMHDRVFDHSTFSQSRDRLLEHGVAQMFFSSPSMDVSC